VPQASNQLIVDGADCDSTAEGPDLFLRVSDDHLHSLVHLVAVERSSSLFIPRAWADPQARIWLTFFRAGKLFFCHGIGSSDALGKYNLSNFPRSAMERHLVKSSRHGREVPVAPEHMDIWFRPVLVKDIIQERGLVRSRE
jgi:hypothetical protein